MNIIEKAKEYASHRHAYVNQAYDQHPYSYHLQKVAQEAERFAHLLTAKESELAIAAAWCHDLIEDTRLTYNDIKQEFNQDLAEIVYALTNEKGRNRAERANDKYYAGIRELPIAVYVKVCDRIANTEFNKEMGKSLYKKYASEYPHFKEKLYSKGQFEELWKRLDALYDR